MILTRYLYQKKHVEFSMFATLFSKNTEESNFWAYELYYSGFKEETIDLLIKYYKTHCFDCPRFSKIEKYIVQKKEEWKKNKKDFILGTIIENISRTYLPTKRLFYVCLNENDILKYKTMLFIEGRGWKIPKRQCLYTCKCDPDEPPKKIQDYWNWVYWASGSPFWRTKILKYGGSIDHKKQLVVFHDEDLEEKFHQFYDMEPDEQSLEIQLKWGILAHEFGTN